jgi:glycosyltransferase involved in cell wall biosynthesis
MRVNIIGNHRKGTGVSQDVLILHGLIVHVLGKETQIRHVPHYYPQCPEAELNFFIEVITPSLFPYAAKNIWIPNPEWTYKTWEPYAKMVDAIWVKTHEAEKLFAEWGVPTRYIGWTSIDKVQPETKNYHKAIVPVGKNIWRNPKPVIQAYMRLSQQNPDMYRALPELHIVHDPNAIKLPPIPEPFLDKIKVHSEVLSETAYDELLQECGLCICMSAAEGFGHAVNEAMSTGSVVMLSPIDAFRELSDDAIWVSNSKVTPHPQCMGTLEDIDVESLMEALVMYSTGGLSWKRSTGALSRSTYEARHQAFVTRMGEVMAEFKDTPAYSLETTLPKEDDLPSVSIITLTKDRRPFLPLAKYCFLSQSYPENKLEWVIVDDGKDQIKDVVSDLPNVT